MVQQNRVSDQSRSPQDQEEKRRQGTQEPKEKKNTAEKQPSTPKAKKKKPMDSDEHDEEPQNEPGTTTVTVLPLQQGPAAISQGPAASSQGHVQVLILVMKTVRIAMGTVHRVRTLEEQYPIQISTF